MDRVLELVTFFFLPADTGPFQNLEWDLFKA